MLRVAMLRTAEPSLSVGIKPLKSMYEDSEVRVTSELRSMSPRSEICWKRLSRFRLKPGSQSPARLLFGAIGDAESAASSGGLAPGN